MGIRTGIYNVEERRKKVRAGTGDCCIQVFLRSRLECPYKKDYSSVALHLFLRL